MIEFDKDDMTLVRHLNEQETRAFILFLLSERRRHLRDIGMIDARIIESCERFGWEYKAGEQCIG